MDHAIWIALVAAGFAAPVGFDRDRAFYPTVVVVIGSYYVMFAVLGGSLQAVVLESSVMTGFAAVAVLGFRGKLWIVAAALARHDVFDAIRISDHKSRCSGVVAGVLSGLRCHGSARDDLVVKTETWFCKGAIGDPNLIGPVPLRYRGEDSHRQWAWHHRSSDVRR